MAIRVIDSQRAEIDRLVEWYKKFKPAPGRRIPTNFTSEQLRAILNKPREDVAAKEYKYRDVVILAKGESP